MNPASTPPGSPGNPLPASRHVRLGALAPVTEQRCLLCHPATNYTRNSHALPGWWAATLRMKYVNNAPVTWAELRIIVPHLAVSATGI